MRKPDQRDVLECVHYANVMDFLMHISTGHYHCLEYCTNYNENHTTATFINQRCVTPTGLKKEVLSFSPACRSSNINTEKKKNGMTLDTGKLIIDAGCSETLMLANLR